MINFSFIKNQQYLSKKLHGKQTGLTKITSAGLKIMLFFKKMCI